jgi:hypothetical protein
LNRWWLLRFVHEPDKEVWIAGAVNLGEQVRVRKDDHH